MRFVKSVLILTLILWGYAFSLAALGWSIQRVVYVISLPEYLQATPEQIGLLEFRTESLGFLWSEAIFYMVGVFGWLTIGYYLARQEMKLAITKSRKE